MAYTTANFLTSVQRQAFLPTGQATFATSDILSMGDEAMQRYILPALLGVREEYFVTYKDYTITANQATYLIPPRAVGAAVREVQLINTNGSVFNIERISLDQLHGYSSTASSPDCFYLRGDKIVLLPTPSSTTGTLRVYYAIRPGELIETSSSGVISAINTSTNVITITSIPSAWVTGDTFDLISREGSQLYLDTSLTSTLISGSNITLPSLPSDLAVGDYVALTGYSPLIQLPPDLRPTLAGFVAAEMLIAMNQPTGTQLLDKAMKDLETALKLLTPRTVGAMEVIIPDWS